MRIFSALSTCSSVLALVLLQRLGAAELLHGRSYYEEHFVDWMREFSIDFETGREFAHRLAVFAKNHDFIMAHNSRGNETYWLKHNAFSHLTLDEFHQRFRLGQYRRNVQSFTDVRSGKHEHLGLRGGEVPSEVDWVTKGAVTPVKDQGMCGSCWAFSTTGALEGAYFLANGKLVSFSEQELVDCDHVDSGCGGGLMDNAMAWITKNGGLATEQSYPYEGTDRSCDSSAPNVPGSAIKKYTDVQPTDSALTAAIAKQPVAVAIEADQPSFQFYGGGVLSGDCGTNLDHGVLAVGYGNEGGLPYYLVKNSWGPSWGDQGFIKLQKGKDVEGGQCGILLAASYPTTVSSGAMDNWGLW